VFRVCSVHIRHSDMFHVLIYVTELKWFFCMVLTRKMDHIYHVEEDFTESVLVFELASSTIFELVKKAHSIVSSWNKNYA
jgi:hypothetical protein